ncbi:MAG: aminotransferase class I/II-fold pyridoxal phosphate-dependent enzyme, partial [Enterococcus aquimarinus]|nr:aminotransferase class I/II-fold pyridoxal phosphate-dependent enzyme [Enterococcus aquimarinus]
HSVAVNQEELAKWETFLEAKQLPYYHSQANFIFFDVKQDSKALAQQLMQRGFIVRAGLRPEWLRITIGHAADNQAIRMILEELL